MPAAEPDPVPAADDPSGMPVELSPEAHSLYMRILQAGGRLSAPGLLPDLHDGRLVRELQNLGLLVPDVESPGGMIAGDPRQLADSLSSELQTRAVELLARSMTISASLQSLGRAYYSYAGHASGGGAIEYIETGAAINRQLALLLEDCEKEMLTAQPGGGRRAEAIKVAIERDMRFVQRGGTMRTIYQPSARYSAPTVEYVSSVTQEGCQVRTLDEPFTRVIVMDRKVAVIPVSDEDREARAAFIRDEAVISYIVQLFDSMWDRSIPFTGAREIPPQVVSSMRQQIIRMMLQGIGHRTIARRLGLSERTLARHIAEMREEYGVDTLFQLGWKLAQLEAGAGGAGRVLAETDLP